MPAGKIPWEGFFFPQLTLNFKKAYVLFLPDFTVHCLEF